MCDTPSTESTDTGCSIVLISKSERLLSQHGMGLAT